MKSSKTTTFAEIRRQLKDLGFTLYAVNRNGKRAWLFERDRAPGANIYLPDYADDEAVAQFDLNFVHMALKSRGLIQETVRNDA